MKKILQAIFIFLLCSQVSCNQQEPNYPKRQMPTGLLQDQVGLAAAANLFRKSCAYCHGHPNEGRGERADFFQPPAHDFYQQKYRYVDPAYLFWRISEGKTVEPFLSRGSVMPAWGPHFTEREIWLLVAYVQQRPVDR